MLCLKWRLEPSKPCKRAAMITQSFKDIFGYSPMITGFTPGRVNLIGEHTDYNGGMVLPTALTLGISIAFSPRTDNKIRISSDKFEGLAQRSLLDKVSGHWSDYILGAVILANEQGYLSGGADIAVETNLPFGAGISSSAAVTVGILKLARDQAGQQTSDEEIAVLARRVENDFIGMPCGIMDQMAVALATANQALAVNTKTLEYALIDLPRDYHMAVIHSGVFRQLNEGRYKERKEECDAVKAALGHDNICLISDVEFASLSNLPLMLQRRAKHCMSEHRRTVEAVSCLETNDIERFGQLMNESHISMRDDFEITVPQINDLVEDAVAFGAMGARLTGGGFGGCIVAAVHIAELETWSEKLIAKHPAAFKVA